MNILSTPWLPTDIGTVTPATALARAKQIEWSRGDWSMATFCFLHALVQTAVVLSPDRCPDRQTWSRLLDSPPDLEAWFDFNLGEHPWECPTAEGLVPVAKLLPETPGENTLKQAKDIGSWLENAPATLSLNEATIALISDNLWGTRIGVGHYQGVRGEQSLTTILEPAEDAATLWQRVWLNVLPADAWHRRYGSLKGSQQEFVFPWLAPLSDEDVTPDNSNPLALLWQMPRRWRLVVSEDGTVTEVHRQNRGRNYAGWEKLHPLTPYFAKNDGEWVAAKVAPHTGFDDWAAIALQLRRSTMPAIVVSEFMNTAWNGEALRLRCCGWALLDGAVGSWVDNAVPFYLKGTDQVEAIERSLEVTEAVIKRLRLSLGSARKGLQVHANKLYSRIEADFFRRVASDTWDGWEEGVIRAAREFYWRVIEDHGVDLMAATKKLKAL